MAYRAGGVTLTGLGQQAALSVMHVSRHIAAAEAGGNRES